MIAVEAAVQPETKDFLIYRLDARGHAEIAGESSLEIEARRFAGIMAATETEIGVCYEARRADGDELLFTTR